MFAGINCHPGLCFIETKKRIDQDLNNIFMKVDEQRRPPKTVVDVHLLISKPYNKVRTPLIHSQTDKGN